MMRVSRLVALTALALVAACAQKREAARPPAPAQPAQPRPVPPPPPPPPPAAAPNWGDIALTAGNWVYRPDGNGSRAEFGGANSQTVLSFRCDRGQRRIILTREGAASGSHMAIRTSFGARNVDMDVDLGASPTSRATFAASDGFLDSIVFSRGRFTVETPGLPMLVIPTWPEPARVVEDCRA